MKPIISILLLLAALQLYAVKKQPVFFIENYWQHFEYYYQKQVAEKLTPGYFPAKTRVIFYGSETSLLQQKLLFHEIGVPQFFKKYTGNEDVDVPQYLKWIIFAKENPRKNFPDIIRRPLGYVPNFITESFYRFGISVPFN